MKSKRRHLSQAVDGLTRMTKREEKAARGYGRSGNAITDDTRRSRGLLADHVKDKV